MNQMNQMNPMMMNVKNQILSVTRTLLKRKKRKKNSTINLIANSTMHNQDIILYSLVAVAAWLMFFRKTSGYAGCAACMAA